MADPTRVRYTVMHISRIRWISPCVMSGKMVMSVVGEIRCTALKTKTNTTFTRYATTVYQRNKDCPETSPIAVMGRIKNNGANIAEYTATCVVAAKCVNNPNVVAVARQILVYNGYMGCNKVSGMVVMMSCGKLMVVASVVVVKNMRRSVAVMFVKNKANNKLCRVGAKNTLNKLGLTNIVVINATIIYGKIVEIMGATSANASANCCVPLPPIVEK